MTRRFLWPVVAGAAVFAILVLWRHFFWQHAAIIGLAVTALVYSILRTGERLKTLHRR